MYSPKSDSGSQSQTRYSTPVSDLDDHRHQTSTRPLGETMAHPQSPLEGKASQHTSLNNAVRSDLLQVNEGLGLCETGPISRDFEHAIIDDDKSGTGENIIEQKGSLSPAVPKRVNHRRSQNLPNRSRESSRSSHSSSDANSVDAFADTRRRGRANTAGSRAPSDLEIGLSRAVSSGTHHRRPTLNDGSVRDFKLQGDHASYHDPAEDDVCFPAPDESKRYRIDYEELEEFAAEHCKPRAPDEKVYPRQKLSFSSHGTRPLVFNDLNNQTIPKITTKSASPIKLSLDLEPGDSDEILNEKLADPLGANGPQPRQHSFLESSRYSFFSSELEQTIHAAEFPDLLGPGEKWRDLFELPEDGGVWWLDVSNPTEEELHAFQRAFGIHRLTTEDIITQEVREKVELFKQYYFVCFRSFDQINKDSEHHMEPVNVYMVVFREGILTITYTHSPHAANVRQRIGKLRDYMALTADWICYAMMYVVFSLVLNQACYANILCSDNIVDSFAPPIHSIEREADSIEDTVFVARTDDLSDLLQQIGGCRKKVMSLMRLLGGKADVIKGFAKRCNESYSVTPRGEIGLYLGDIQDHVVTMMSNLGHFEKMLSRSHSNYLAQLSVDNIRQGNRANEVLSKITLLATILVPLNLICGLFGMNVQVPGKDSEGLGWFFGIIGVIAAIVVLCLAVARKFRFI